MSEEGAGQQDPYASARENLRDTIKWLVAAFAGIAAVVVAGSPFAGIGALDPRTDRFLLASLCLVAAFCAVMRGLYKTLELLRPDGLYATELRDPPAPRTDARGQELAALRQTIDAHKDDLFPPQLPSRTEFLDAFDGVSQQFGDAKKAGGAIPQALSENLALLDQRRRHILYFALYTLARQRLDKEMPRLAGCAGVALIALVGFAAAANPPAPPGESTTAHIVLDRSADLSSLPTLGAVTFAPGSAQVPQGELAKVTAAQEILLRSPGVGVLLLAQGEPASARTPGRGTAHERGEAVRRLLLDAGVAANRIYVAEVEAAAPRPAGGEPLDRTVQLQLVALSRE